MGQLHALHAESQIRQRSEALTLAAWPNVQHAEISWQSAESFFRWAASYAREMITKEIEPNDSSTRPIWKFFDAMAVNTAALSRMCSTHRLSTHLSGLSLTEMKSEVLSRTGSICARRALTLVHEANTLLSDRPNTSFSQQLRWSLGAYETRWTAIYFQSELNIYKLDANPEIAIYFCEALLRLRTPQFPPGPSQSQDPNFSQCAHELQLIHHTHLTEAIDQKKALLGACRDRFGTTWAFQALDKCVGVDLLTIRDIGPVFRDEERVGGSAIEEDEVHYTSPFLVEVIAANVEAALLHSKLDDPQASIASEASEIILTKTPQPVERSITRSNKGLTECRIVTPAANATTQPDQNAAKPKALSSGQLIKRPSSATQQSSGWVTMSYGGKLLHFEKSIDPLIDPCQRNSASGQDGHLVPRQTKPRPSSSPCYLSSKWVSVHDTVSAGRQLENGKMWAPTRASCALCERRFMRSSLPGVVLMKRIYDLRRKWGVIQDSKKYNAASALYATASVCLFCQEILAYEESRQPTHSKALGEHQPHGLDVEASAPILSVVDPDKDAEIARMIHESILCQWHQQLSSRMEDNNLQDIAVNKRVRQSSTVCSMKAQNALDPDTNRSAHTKEEFQPWWEIDLANYVEVHSVKVYLRDEVSHLYAAARGLTANPARRTTGVYPLHISVSMKTGVGRDCDDIIASCVSSLCVPDKVTPPIEWVAPHKSRGRFIRVQCQGHAILHIERVHVFVAKTPTKVVNDPLVMRQHVRQVLQRTAFRASVIATAATSASSGSSKIAVAAEPTPKRRMSTLAAHSSQRQGSHVALNKAESESQSLFFDPQRAEKRRVSRLYSRFKSLLDARAKYVAPEEETDEEVSGSASETQTKK
ncbi:hypothetical protein PF010_g2491 [Phytophthora fragariae]|uniref:Fucolectin tachylectin-4 pentraxin-1 domain-containing protein n=1 Tax=Phytophthora fragariae TaxID=53985 RepID=A0A6G0LXW2_9STRA|nr:hypothetical protein PF010_g2491 [Phytophthora fragariae]